MRHMQPELVNNGNWFALDAANALRLAFMMSYDGTRPTKQSPAAFGISKRFQIPCAWYARIANTDTKTVNPIGAL